MPVRRRSTVPDSPLETAVMGQILSYLALKNVYVWRNNTGAAKFDDRWVKFGHSGASDILGLAKGGRFLAIEVKRPGDAYRKPKTEQIDFLSQIHAFGGLAGVARSLDDVDRILNGEFLVPSNEKPPTRRPRVLP